MNRIVFVFMKNPPGIIQGIKQKQKQKQKQNIETDAS